MAYLADWLNLLLRWAHVITGIAWIGSSFYFMWLDDRLNVPPRDPENNDVTGDLWAVHGGGFYHSQKYKVAPGELPEPLHWFKWEAYFTWMTGFLLMIGVYYLHADTYLIDPRVTTISPATAIAVSVALLVAGWYVYCVLCSLPISPAWTASVGGIAVLSLCWALSLLFSGRGAFLQVGAMLGTIMAANVFRVIIPSQKQLVAAKLENRDPDPALGRRAKQRSVHNSYLTLPVVFTMISPHYAFIWGHAYNWLILFVLFILGGLIRHYFNLRNQGRNVIALPLASLAIFVLLVLALPYGSDADRGSATAGDVNFSQVQQIISERCVACHSSSPTHPTAPVPAAGVTFDSPQEISAWSARIYERAVVSSTMPLANTTEMTDDERAVLAAWFTRGAGVE